MKNPRYALLRTAAIRIRPALPPGTTATFSQLYLLSFPWRWWILYRLAIAARSGFIPAVGPYSRPAIETSIFCGRSKHPGISSTSGAPWPRFAQASGPSAKPCSFALSVHQITPVEARDGSRPAWGRWPSWALRNCLWMLDFNSLNSGQSFVEIQGRVRSVMVNDLFVPGTRPFANGESAAWEAHGE